MRDHYQLRAFELADQVTMEVYAVTKAFPAEERFGLVTQMRRAAVSVPSNIVEGCARSSIKEYRRFLEVAFGSLRELGYQIRLCQKLGYVRDDFALQALMTEAEKVLGALIRSQRPPKT